MLHLYKCNISILDMGRKAKVCKGCSTKLLTIYARPAPERYIRIGYICKSCHVFVPRYEVEQEEEEEEVKV